MAIARAISGQFGRRPRSGGRRPRGEVRSSVAMISRCKKGRRSRFGAAFELRSVWNPALGVGREGVVHLKAAHQIVGKVKLLVVFGVRRNVVGGAGFFILA